jgi:hypothetical protein
MKGELRQMVAQGSGAIVNCSSIGGLKGSRGRSAYSASKHAVSGLTRSAALDYAAMGIRINAVCPGMVNTPMAAFVTKNYDPEIVSRMVAQEPIGRFGEPEEIAAAVVWLCSPAASFMVGHAMTVDGGLLRRLIAGAEVKNICTLTARFRPFSVTQLRIRNGSSCPEAYLRPTQSQGQRGVDSGPSGLTSNDRTWDF